MSKFVKAGLLCALVLGGTADVSAQGPTGPMFVIHQEIVSPGKVAEYEAGSKAFIAMIQQHRATMPDFSYDAIMGEDFVYTFIAPIKDMGGMDAIGQQFGAMAQAGGAKWAELMARNDENIEYYSEWVASLAPDVSYYPANPRIKQEEAKFNNYDFYYLKSGKGPDAMAIAKDYKELFASKGIRNGYQIFVALTGSELPLLVVQSGAKSPADFAASLEADQAALGDAGKALAARAMAITRRFETKGAWGRPDLSLAAMAPAKKP